MEIYCDASMDHDNQICAWGYVIRYKDREHSYANHRIMKKEVDVGEILAAVKALGKTKAYQIKEVTIYSDYQEMIDICARFEGKKKLKDRKKLSDSLTRYSSEKRALYCCLFDYHLKYKLSVQKINRKDNPAHKIAYAELQKAKQSLLLDKLPVSVDTPDDI